jgi:glycerol-3-phosphate dehydrogenase subunit C
MLPIYLSEPCNQPARQRAAATIARRTVPLPVDLTVLARAREQAASRSGALVDAFERAVAERGISVSRAATAAAAAERIAALAAGTPVAATRAAVLGELFAALTERGVQMIPTYGPRVSDFVARYRRFWQLPHHALSTNWRIQAVSDRFALATNEPVVEGSPPYQGGVRGGLEVAHQQPPPGPLLGKEGVPWPNAPAQECQEERTHQRRDVVGLFGVNAASAASGAIHLLQHSDNIGDLLRTARHLVFIVAIDKLVADDAAARHQVDAIGTYGADSVLLDLARTRPQSDPLERFAPTDGEPSIEVILLDNGRTELLRGQYRSLFTCIGCRACATRCPTYPEFRGPRGWSPKDYLWSHLRGDNPALDLCTLCGNCEVDCPLDIPLPTLIAQRRVEHLAMHGRGLNGWRRRLHGEVERIGKAFSATAPLSTYAPRLPLAATVMDKVFGLASERALPAFRRDTFERWHHGRETPDRLLKKAESTLREPQGERKSSIDSGRGSAHAEALEAWGGVFQQPAETATGARPRLVYYFGCFANYNNPEVGQATVKLLDALGYDVVLPDWKCCGIPLYAKGELGAARRMVEFNVNALVAYVDAGDEIITSCPSCQLALARDYPRLFPSEAADRVAAHTHFLSRFLLKAGGLDGHLGALRLGPLRQRAAYHLPCHLRALGMEEDTLQLLAQIPDFHASDMQRGCCGLSGTFGLERDHYTQSMDIGSGLFAAVTDAEPDLVLTDCGACKLQIEHGTKRQVTHPLEVLCRAVERGREARSLIRPGAAGGNRAGSWSSGAAA